MTFTDATSTRTALRLAHRARYQTDAAARRGVNGPLAAYYPMFTLSSAVRS